MSLEDKLLEIIELKHKELNLGQDYQGKFAKIKDFEGNAIGQIGETFLKHVIGQITPIDTSGTIHDEYDVITTDGLSFEVKTARKGRNNTFQFNGLNPQYNYDYLVCLGLTSESVLYRVFRKTDIQYIHKDRGNKKRGHYLIQEGLEKKLVRMNPGNSVNHKITLRLENLHSISTFTAHIQAIIAENT